MTIQPHNEIDALVEEFYPHTCREKIKEVEQKLKCTADCLCDPTTQKKREKLRSALTTLQHNAVERERERIIKITTKNKDAFMMPATEQRWLQALNTK